MNSLDWIVLSGTLLFIVSYGIWKTRGSKNIEGYLLGDKSMKWGTIGLSIMATQASAITFLSTPGQAYLDGMRFIQIYFGLPLAIVIICVFVIPIYHRLKVYTAYEYLESRFDLKSRFLTAFLFLVSRGLQAGLRYTRRRLFLSSILDLSLNITILIIGILVIVYTVSGGTKAVSQTQKQQMFVIMVGMFIAFGMLIYLLPANVGFKEAVNLGGNLGKMNLIDFSFDPSERYTFWSGIFGGVVLSASYFGTDQSQVQRYLGGKSVAESRFGLLFNGLFKIPMQFFILLVGVMVFVFYQFYQPPVFFNQVETDKLYQTEYADELTQLEQEHQSLFQQKEGHVQSFLEATELGNQSVAEQHRSEISQLIDKSKDVHDRVGALILKNDPQAEANDDDYIFITFVIDYLPHGLVGLLMAVIFSAAMSSTSSELNALASTTVVDFYKRTINQRGSERHYLVASKLFTVGWGVIAILFAIFSSLLDNLIEAINILGSVFYGTILGIFVVAFAFKYVKANAVFIAVFVAEAMVIGIYLLSNQEVVEIEYLWLNPIGCLLVIIISFILQWIFNQRPSERE